MPAGAQRARSALGWIALAVVLVAAAGVVYLRPNLTPPATPTAPAGPPPRASTAELTIGGAWFEDADHGAVTLLPVGFVQGSTPSTYLTSDGGRTWRRPAL